MSDLVQVKGLKELNQFLQQLPAKIERNVLRGALRAGARPVQQQAKANAPKDTGQLAAGIKISTGGKGGTVIAKVKLTGKHAFLGPWMEYGTAAHRIVAKGDGWLFFGGAFAKAINHPGIQPRPFMAPALYSQATPAVVAAAEYMKKRLATKFGLDTSDVEIEA
jgi:HK97 gp10 family phage protein